MRLQICLAATFVFAAGCSDYEKIAMDSLTDWTDVVLTEGEEDGHFEFTGINAEGLSCAGTVIARADSASGGAEVHASCAESGENADDIGSDEADSPEDELVDDAQHDPPLPALDDPFHANVEAEAVQNVLRDDLIAQRGGTVELWPTAIAGIFTYEQQISDENFHVGILVASNYGGGSYSSWRQDVSNADADALAAEYADRSADREATHALIDSCAVGEFAACGTAAAYLNNAFEDFTMDVASAVLSVAMTGCMGGDTNACSEVIVTLVEGNSNIISNDAFGPVAAALLEESCEDGNEAACAAAAIPWAGQAGDALAGATRAQEACSAGDPRGCAGAGILYILSNVDDRMDRAADWLMRGCELGDPYSCRRTSGWATEATIAGNEFEPAIVDRLFTSVCERGDAAACVLLGHTILEGPGGWTRDYARVISILEPICALDDQSDEHINGCYWLGMARQGAALQGEPNGEEEFRIVCDAGYERGCAELGE